MQRNTASDGFAAVKAKWRENATKFGTPLPTGEKIFHPVGSSKAGTMTNGETLRRTSSEDAVPDAKHCLLKTEAEVRDSECVIPSLATTKAGENKIPTTEKKDSVLARWQETISQKKASSIPESSEKIFPNDPDVDIVVNLPEKSARRVWQLAKSFRHNNSAESKVGIDRPAMKSHLVVTAKNDADAKGLVEVSRREAAPIRPLEEDSVERAKIALDDRKSGTGRSPTRLTKDWWLARKGMGDTSSHSDEVVEVKKFRAAYPRRASTPLASPQYQIDNDPSPLVSVQTSIPLAKTSKQLGCIESTTITKERVAKSPKKKKTLAVTLTSTYVSQDSSDDESYKIDGISSEEINVVQLGNTSIMSEDTNESKDTEADGGEDENNSAQEGTCGAVEATACITRLVSEYKSGMMPPSICGFQSSVVNTAPCSMQLKNSIKTSRPCTTVSATPTRVIKGNSIESNHENINRSPLRRRGLKQMVIRENLDKDQNYTNLPVFKHTDAEEDVILQAIYNTDIFSTVTTGQMKQLVAAFEKAQFAAGDIILHEGGIENDFFYVMERGLVELTSNERHIGICEKGGSFGELALLYTCPSSFTVLALEDSHLYRIDGLSFRTILATECKRSQLKKLRLLQGIYFLENVPADAVKMLAEAMIPRKICDREKVMEKGHDATAFYVVAEGRLLCQENSSKPLKTGDYFGEDTLAAGDKVKASVVATEDSMVFSISRQIFEKALGAMSKVIVKDQNIRRLSQIPFVRSTVECREQTAALADHLREKSYSANEVIMVEREVTKANIYLVCKGSVLMKRSNTNGTETEEVITPGGYFGDTLMQRAQNRSRRSVKSPYSISSSNDGVTVAVLSLKDFWSVVDPSRLVVKEKNVKEDIPTTTDAKDDKELTDPTHSTAPSLMKSVAPVLNIKPENLLKHIILGEGTFGRVWLVSDNSTNSENERRAYALKIQSKAYLVEENQVEAVIQEKIMMENMMHPFLIQLFATYQDDFFVYMVLDFVQGGELFSLMHEDDSFSITEPGAKFYALCIADVLAYLHRGKYVYRDLKPENIMIDSKGYIKLIDFGFCKYLLSEKTYTLCGTPGYLAPEVVTMAGHDWSADHWSLGILIYEMLTGESPFYYEDIDQSELFLSIVNDPFKAPSSVSPKAADIMGLLLMKDPSRRLGASGEMQVTDHPWFDGLSLDALSRKDPSIEVPWIPKVSGPLDTSYFNEWSELERESNETGDISKKGRPLSPRDAKIFEGVF